MTKREQKELRKYQAAKNMRFARLYGATEETMKRVFGSKSSPQEEKK